MPKNKDTYIQIGKCFKPHGIKGSFSLVLLHAESRSLSSGSKIFLKPHNEKSNLLKAGEEHVIASIQYGIKTVFRLEGVESRNEVESYIPFEIFMHRSDLPELEDDEIYMDDLVGLDVLEDGEKIGKVFSYYDHGASEILLIELLTKEKIDIPFIDNFIENIDLDAGSIEIKRPEYL